MVQPYPTPLRRVLSTSLITALQYTRYGLGSSWNAPLCVRISPLIAMCDIIFHRRLIAIKNETKRLIALIVSHLSSRDFEQCTKYYLLLSTWHNVASCVVVLWTELVSRMENQRGHWVCWMSTSRKKGLIWRTHTWTRLFIHRRCRVCFHISLSSVLLFCQLSFIFRNIFYCYFLVLLCFSFFSLSTSGLLAYVCCGMALYNRCLHGTM